jgi:F-type H+-transporting ATPase subunit a
MTLLTSFLFSEPDTLKSAMHHEEGSDWIIEHVSDHPFLKIQPFQIGGINVDLSITTNVLMMILAALLLITILTYAALSNRKNKTPKGIGNLIEIMILFIKDDIVIPSMGESGVKFLPFFFSLFFFVLFANLIGLIPYLHTPTGNVNITATLALITFAMTQVHGIKHNGFVGYFKGLMPPGVPIFVMPIMVIIEFLSLLTKPFALCIRLFANMMAGHIVILAFISLIFTLGYAIVPVSIAFSLFIYVLEIFVALLQAFIFTMLSALFIGMGIHQEH